MVIRKDFSKDKPLLTTAIVAEMLDITPDRLRMYDTENLIRTYRIKSGKIQKRLYSQNDVEWLQNLRTLLKDHKMSISSLKILLQIVSLNQNIKLPHNDIGEVLRELMENPNFTTVVKNF